MAERGGVQVDGMREAIRDLDAFGHELEDVHAVGKIADAAADEVAKHSPKRSRRLANSARPSTAKNVAFVTVTVPWAGPIFYGWARRNIRPSNTIARADAAMETEAPRILETDLDRITTKYGFN